MKFTLALTAFTALCSSGAAKRSTRLRALQGDAGAPEMSMLLTDAKSTDSLTRSIEQPTGKSTGTCDGVCFALACGCPQKLHEYLYVHLTCGPHVGYHEQCVPSHYDCANGQYDHSDAGQCSYSIPFFKWTIIKDVTILERVECCHEDERKSRMQCSSRKRLLLPSELTDFISPHSLPKASMIRNRKLSMRGSIILTCRLT